MFVLSILTTRGSTRRLPANCPYPTSTAYTFEAPCCSKQSVNPPVEAPTSSTMRPDTSIPKADNADSSFSPPLLTYFLSLPLIRIWLDSETSSPSLSTTRSLTRTFPAIIQPCALFLSANSPRLTSSSHRRTLSAFLLIGILPNSQSHWLLKC